MPKTRPLFELPALLAFAASLAACGGAGTGQRESVDDGSEQPMHDRGPNVAGNAANHADSDGGLGDLPGAVTRCYFDAEDAERPKATLEYAHEAHAKAQLLHVRLTLSPNFVDNTYGASGIGWESAKKGVHRFTDLSGSDHARLVFTDASGDAALDVRVDYLSRDATRPSGYGTLGVRAGDGQVLSGVAEAVVAARTSLDANLNDRGYASYVVDSPATDAGYTANPAAPLWDYRVVYDLLVDPDLAFTDDVFQSVHITHVHASPSKGTVSNVEVQPGDCPIGWCPGGLCR